VPRTDNIYELPTDLPVPVDDGACAHLTGLVLPSIPLPSTAGRLVDLAALRGRTIVYAYPRTGRPDREIPKGWDQIPGARGCTPESCGFRDLHAAFRARGAAVYGLSTQSTEYQREAVARLRLPFELLSDERLALTNALRLPTFVVESMILIKRLTLAVRDGRIEKVFYPIFPPDAHAAEVERWLTAAGAAS